MRFLKIGQRTINLDLVTSIQDMPVTKAAGKGKGKGKDGSAPERRGGIRVTFERENFLDFTDEEAEDLLRFLEAHSYLPPPGPAEPIEDEIEE